MTTAAFPTESKRMSLGDSFVSGVMIMLVINVGQRVIGLLRNLGFCQFLSDAQLGHWALANSFFMIAAPIVVLGLPGSFGKFTETYRIRSALRTYFGRIAVVSGIGAIVFTSLMVWNSAAVAWFVYGDLNGDLSGGSTLGSGSHTQRVVVWMALALLAQVAYNFLYEVNLSLRHVRVISWMQFTQGISFAVIGVTWLSWSNDWSVLLPSYAVCCLLATLLGVWCAWTKSADELGLSGEIPHKEMWPRILPFAAALWIANLLSNSFELSDRYMLLHFSTGGETVGQAAVGQYFCGRIIPNLLMSVALMLGGVILPYLSQDWEAGRRDAVESRIRQLLAIVTISFTAISVAAIVCSPILFDGIFAGRYSEAKAILPLSLLHCTWSSLGFIAGSYLLCAERVHVGSMILFVGLILNLALNAPLIQHFGLTGSVIATAVANWVVMLLTFRSLGRYGCPLSRRTIGLTMLPAVILCGPAIAIYVVGGMIFLAGRTEWVLCEKDRGDIDALVIPRLQRFGIPVNSLWP